MSAGLNRKPLAQAPIGVGGRHVEHALGPHQVLGEPEHDLAVRVLQGLAQRRIGSRLLVHLRRDLAQLVVPQDLAFDVGRREPLAQLAVAGDRPRPDE